MPCGARLLVHGGRSNGPDGVPAPTPEAMSVGAGRLSHVYATFIFPIPTLKLFQRVGLWGASLPESSLKLDPPDLSQLNEIQV
jgi:hypothetical protein